MNAKALIKLVPKKYKIKAKDVDGNTNYSLIYIAYNAPALANAIFLTGGSSGGILSNFTVDSEFIAQATSVYVVLRNEIVTINLYNNFDDISIFPVDIVPTTEIPESRNYMNHIVHADADGGVLYVEELPKIEYKNVIKANINSNRKYVNYTNKRFFSVEYINDLPYDIDIILTATCTSGTAAGTAVYIDDVLIQFDSARDVTFSHTLPARFTVPSGSKFLLPIRSNISINSWFQYE